MIRIVMKIQTLIFGKSIKIAMFFPRRSKHQRSHASSHFTTAVVQLPGVAARKLYFSPPPPILYVAISPTAPSLLALPYTL